VVGYPHENQGGFVSNDLAYYHLEETRLQENLQGNLKPLLG